MDHGQFVGTVGSFSTQFRRAYLWDLDSGTGAPLKSDSLDSDASAVSAGEQVGSVMVGYPTDIRWHAALWRGTEDFNIDLNPDGARGSTALGESHGVQVGFAEFSARRSACLWRGTAESWVDLGPESAAESRATCVSGEQQGGYAIIDGQTRASLWSGTISSWISLDPSGSTKSEVADIDRGIQVGYAIVAGRQRASLWSGSAASWIDLGQILPSEFFVSSASGVWRSGGFTYVVGSASSTVTGRTEAVMWTASLCGADFNSDGFVTGDDYDSFVAAFVVGSLIADFNGDGFVAGDDFDGFVDLFVAGC